MASASQDAVVRPFPTFGPRGLLDKYFYFGMSLLVAGIVVWGFSHTINDNLFHPAIRRPFLLWIHGAAFSGWVALYIVQSALVRTRNVRVHRTLGWFGLGLAIAMVVLGLTIAVIMGRFDKHILHIPDADVFLSVPFGDMLVFSVLIGLAIYWRRKPELHRRLMLMGTCALLDAPFGRVDYIFNHSLFFVGVDAVILLGIGRDLLVNRRIHKVYLVAMPLMIALQAFLVYLWRGTPSWWVGFARAIVG